MVLNLQMRISCLKHGYTNENKLFKPTNENKLFKTWLST